MNKHTEYSQSWSVAVPLLDGLKDLQETYRAYKTQTPVLFMSLPVLICVVILTAFYEIYILF